MKITDIYSALKLVPDRSLDVDRKINKISIDSREISPNDLFVAIQGENFDGNNFIQAAQYAGAIAAIVSKKNIEIDLLQIEVADTDQALGLIGAYWRAKFSIPMIAITGSQGKTTVREMIASILKLAIGKEKVLVSKKNFNNHWGLPLTLCELNSQHQYAVLELGMNGPGEIAYLTKLCDPTIAVITLAAATHTAGVENGVAGIAKAKGELFENLTPTAKAVLNHEDEFFEYWKSLINKKDFYSFGLSQEADIYIDKKYYITPKGKININLSLPGEHNMQNALSAISAVLLAKPDIDLTIIKQALENIKPVSGRLEFLKSTNGAIVINDSYNSSPASIEAALKVLAKQDGKKILVLSDMAEIGEHEIQAHQDLAKLIDENKVDCFIAIGKLIKHAYDYYKNNKKAYFENKAQAENYIKDLDRSNTVFLVKGSRGMQMEKIVKLLL